MKEILFINPLKPGKLNEYKAFVAEITGPRLEEYVDLLKRYGLKNSKVHYHKLGETEFVTVNHEVEEDAAERLAIWSSSTHPFDIWFKEQLSTFQDIELAKEAGQPQLLFTFDPMK